MLLLQVSAEAAELPGGYGIALLQTLLALAAVCMLAWVVLRWAAQRGLGIGASGTRVKVIERVALDARRTLWLVQIGEKVLLLGAGDNAPPALLAELREDELPKDHVTPSVTFMEALRRAGAKKQPSSATPLTDGETLEPGRAVDDDVER